MLKPIKNLSAHDGEAALPNVSVDRGLDIRTLARIKSNDNFFGYFKAAHWLGWFYAALKLQTRTHEIISFSVI